jgi:pimeloyl-ACP methyl ester carboxylesterase
LQHHHGHETHALQVARPVTVVRNLKSVEYVEKLPTIKVPTLIIAGDHDESDPSLSRQMNAKIAGSKLVILPERGHMTFVDQPILFINAVEQFLRSK